MYLRFHVRNCFCIPSGETVTSHGSIEPDKDHIREEPYSLPQGFSWDTLDLGNPAVVSECINTHTLGAGMHMRNASFSHHFLDSLCLQVNMSFVHCRLFSCVIRMEYNFLKCEHLPAPQKRNHRFVCEMYEPLSAFSSWLVLISHPLCVTADG